MQIAIILGLKKKNWYCYRTNEKQIQFYLFKQVSREVEALVRNPRLLPPLPTVTIVSTVTEKFLTKIMPILNSLNKLINRLLHVLCIQENNFV